MVNSVRHGRFMGAESWTLEDDVLRAVILPAHGGKLASVWHKEKGFELLFQNPFGYFRQAERGSAFKNFEACGFDDAFPNINAETVGTEWGAIEYYDHGEIWSAQFSCEKRAGRLSMAYHSPALGYDYEKTITLSDNAVKIFYSICNNSSKPFPCFWACHCLVNYRSDMRLMFPQGTKRVMAVADSELLGPAGSVYRFPKDVMTSGTSYDFRTVPKADGKTMLKYYCLDPSEQGLCGYVYPTEGIAAKLHYDSAVLPYLGFWMTAGGFRGDLNCALEPTNGFFDSISTAQRNGKCPVLEPGAKMSFELELELSTL